MYELKTPQFSGPIEKLLELIEAKELDVTRLSLSTVTADFLEYLRSLQEVPPLVLADFIVVAARLVLIKSKALLPSLPLSEEEEEDIQDLENRLRLYKEFKQAGKKIEILLKAERRSFSRELFSSYSIKIFYPGTKLNLGALNYSLDSMLASLQMFAERQKGVIKKTIVSIEQKMQELLTHFTSKSQSKFSEMAKNKDEAIVLFLAILHLIKDRMINIEQESNFSDIIIKPTNSKI
ncbi:MAG: segregation/condensation protein A [Candidatus Liptonbacteria bacterium]|nr:segregation/condensation protein A [Candidatus Liptonbacteria bacterium]